MAECRVWAVLEQEGEGGDHSLDCHVGQIGKGVASSVAYRDRTLVYRASKNLRTCTEFLSPSRNHEGEDFPSLVSANFFSAGADRDLS